MIDEHVVNMSVIIIQVIQGPLHTMVIAFCASGVALITDMLLISSMVFRNAPRAHEYEAHIRGSIWSW